MIQRTAKPQNDMNGLLIDCEQQQGDPQEDYSTSTPDGSVAVYFKDVERRLIDHILKSKVVVGCVAWLTSPKIIDALAQVDGVSIVVQKEDFLRPDISSRSGWSKKLRSMYDRIPSGLDRLQNVGRLHGMSHHANQTIDAIRCVGNHNRDKSPVFPRSHHKFVVFCDLEPLENVEDGECRGIIPTAAWTGSFNFTVNSTRSFENAVYLTDSKIVRAFYNEWSQVVALSEPLNWLHDWAEPEWRIGS